MSYRKQKHRTPVKAMRAKCLDCCAGQYTEVEKCPAIKCPLWLYRFGTRPSKEAIKKYNGG